MTRFPAALQRAVLASLAAVLAGCPLGFQNVQPTLAPPSEQETASALKQALKQGTAAAVDELGQAGGFVDNPRAHIPLPERLSNLAEQARRYGFGGYVDEFEMSLNRAAERAVPAARDVFMDAIRQMTVADALGIIRGPDDAATQYFRRTTADALRRRVRPLVTEATDAVGVTRAYKQLTQVAQPFAGRAGVEVPELDEYVTDRATEAVFDYIAEEEQRIRQDPVARTTERLKRVFGYYDGQRGASG